MEKRERKCNDDLAANVKDSLLFFIPQKDLKLFKSL